MLCRVRADVEMVPDVGSAVGHNAGWREDVIGDLSLQAVTLHRRPASSDGAEHDAQTAVIRAAMRQDRGLSDSHIYASSGALRVRAASQQGAAQAQLAAGWSAYDAQSASNEVACLIASLVRRVYAGSPGRSGSAASRGPGQPDGGQAISARAAPTDTRERHPCRAPRGPCALADPAPTAGRQDRGYEQQRRTHHIRYAALCK